MSYFKIITNRAIFGWTINSSADLKIKIFIFPPLYYFFLISRSLLPISCPVIANPIKSGIDEHEQNGVTVPSNAPTAFAPAP